MKNMIIGQSGGPTAVINSSLAGAIEYALSRREINTIYGMINGIQGLLDGNVMDLTKRFRNKTVDLKKLMLTPAMFLGSCRYRIDDENEMKRIVAELQVLDVGYFFYIGGNDSMDTVRKLADYVKKNNIAIKVIGIPKTIDNDLYGIDHSPGFASAAKYIALAVKNVSYDTSIYSTKSVHIIEAMGRDAGWLAGSAVLARSNGLSAPHLIYLPEIPFSVEKFIDDVKSKLKKYNSVIAVVSEGIKDENGNYISANSSSVDRFGHSHLSGAASYLKDVCEEKIGCKVRYLGLSVLQRSAGHSTSLTDIIEAYNLGVYAVKSALNGKNGVFSTLIRASNHPYSVEYTTCDISVIANQVKHVPRKWINDKGNYVTDEFIEYLTPLVAGDTVVPYINGLPDYLDISHLDRKQQDTKIEPH